MLLAIKKIRENLTPNGDVQNASELELVFFIACRRQWRVLPALHHSRFQANADEVAINILARTRKNKPVLNLVSSDIAVSDAGKPVQISALHLVTARSGGAATITVLFDHMTPGSALNFGITTGLALRIEL